MKRLKSKQSRHSVGKMGVEPGGKKKTRSRKNVVARKILQRDETTQAILERNIGDDHRKSTRQINSQKPGCHAAKADRRRGGTRCNARGERS